MLQMLQSDFVAHLARKGVLRDPRSFDPGAGSRNRNLQDEIDWSGLTKLTPSAFADELAAFYQCGRVQRSDLVGAHFAGTELSARFLKEERIFPYQDESGALTLAIAAPIDGTPPIRVCKSNGPAGRA